MRKIILFVFLITFSLVYGQEPLYPDKHFDLFSGLQARVLYDICKDKDGFIWLATENGVFRFDGKNFHQYTIQDGLCDNEILRIFDDSKGNIWCAGFNCRISVIEDGIVNTQPGYLRQWKTIGIVKDFTEDNQGNIYVLAEPLQLMKIDRYRQVHPVIASPARFQPRKLLLYNDTIFLGGLTSSAFFDDKKGKVTIRDSSENYVSYFISEEHSSFWTNPVPGIYVNDRNPELRADLRAYSPEIRCRFMSQIDDDFLLVSYSQKKPVLYNLKTGAYFILELPVNAIVVDLTVDNNGMLWVITPRDGLYAFKYRDPEVTGTKVVINTHNVIKNYIDEDYLFSVNYNIDLEVIHRKSGAREIIPMELKGTYTIIDYVDIIKSKDAYFFVTNIGVYIYKNGGLKIINDLSTKGAYLYNDTLFFLRSSQSILMASLAELSLPKKKGLPADFDRPVYARCYAILGDGAKLWFSTRDGLSWYDIRTGKIHDMIYTARDDGRISDIKKLGDRKLLLATSSGGLVVLDNEKVVDEITLEDGLLDNDCRQVAVCPSGWIVLHPMGLSLIDTVTWSIKTVSLWNDIPVSTINSMTVYGDTVLFSSMLGLIQTDVRSLFRQYQDARTVKLVRVMSEKYLWPPGDIVLNYNDNRLRIDYALPEYDQPNMIQYFWRINHESWTQTNANTLELPNLQPGNYVLQMMAKAPGFEPTAITELHFRVKPPFWRTPYLWVIVAFALGTALWGILQYRYMKKLRQEREKASVQHQLMSYEQKALNAMMNPHFVFNAMGSIQYLLNNGDTVTANDYLVKFSRLIRKSLETAQTEFCLLEDEIDRLTLYLQMEKMRLDGKMKFEIMVHDDLDTERIQIPTMILQAYIENAVVHGVSLPGKQDGLIRISFTPDTDRLVVVIEDNGPGFDPKNHTRRSRRFGLNATEKRLELLTIMTGKPHRVYVISPVSPDGGTKVMLSIPLVTKTFVG